MKIPKLGLVIQGPLRSAGRTGISLRARGDSKHSADFDCRQNILKLVDDAQNASFGHVVLSTWESERKTVPPGINCDVILSDPPQERTQFRHTKHGDVRVNDAKQLFSTIRGLEHLRALGISHSLKVRTDQWIDLVSIFKASDVFRSKIAFPLKIPDRQDHLNDFFFAGPTTDLIFLCEAAASVAIKPNIHNNLFYAYARKKRLNLIFPVDFYSGSYKKPHNQTPLERHMWKHHLDVFPESVYSDLVWRGEVSSEP